MSARELTIEAPAAWPLPQVVEHTDKDARGRVLVVGGGREVAGAAILSGVAALRAGAGKLQVGAPAETAGQLALMLPEARVFHLPQTRDGELSPDAAEVLAPAVGKADAVVIGPGMLDAEAAGELMLRLALPDGPPLVIDAAAMVALVDAPERVQPLRGRLILTPHLGEMAGLSGRPKEEVAADPLGVARRLAADLQTVIALKGGETFIVTPDGRAWRHTGGCPGLATSGSGDVLSGVIAGLLARGASPAQAAAWGVFAHGAAGRRLAERIAPVGFLARELLDEIAPALAAVGRGQDGAA